VKIVTWNINSIRARTDKLLDWLKVSQPDVLCLQELKCTDDQFPLLELGAAGYQCAVYGQKTYNGVAILSKTPPADVVRGFADGADDEQSRAISATLEGVRVVCLYAPNGQSVGSPAYAYKLEWYGRLKRYLAAKAQPSTPLVVCGDFNVMPEALDVWDPELFNGQCLFSPAERAALKAAAEPLGLVDLYRSRNPEIPGYTFWDYQAGRFHKNHGLRIDHMHVTAPMAERCTAIGVDRDARKNPKPSDHAPLWAEFGP
jgi:exodeoxyribonuclease III